MMAARVLVVEDENIIAKDIAHTLRYMGYEPLGPVATGEEAVQAARIQAPDAALVDILLAGDMDGVDAARLLREECDIPVVFLTACADEGLLERVKPTEPFGYLVKPFEDRELRSTIEIALYAKRLEREKRDAARFSRAALAASADAVVVADEQGRTRLLTPAAERLLGVAQARILDRPVREILALAAETGVEPGDAVGPAAEAGTADCAGGRTAKSGEETPEAAGRADATDPIGRALAAGGRLRARAGDGSVLVADVRRVGSDVPPEAATPGEGAGRERAEIVIVLRRPSGADPARTASAARRSAELAAARTRLAQAELLAEAAGRGGSGEDAARLRAALAEAGACLGRLATLLA